MSVAVRQGHEEDDEESIQQGLQLEFVAFGLERQRAPLQVGVDVHGGRQVGPGLRRAAGGDRAGVDEQRALAPRAQSLVVHAQRHARLPPARARVDQRPVRVRARRAARGLHAHGGVVGVRGAPGGKGFFEKV